jgi:hypothetical protein
MTVMEQAGPRRRGRTGQVVRLVLTLVLVAGVGGMHGLGEASLRTSPRVLSTQAVSAVAGGTEPVHHHDGQAPQHSHGICCGDPLVPPGSPEPDPTPEIPPAPVRDHLAVPVQSTVDTLDPGPPPRAGLLQVWRI